MKKNSVIYEPKSIYLPAWVDEVTGGQEVFPTLEERMALAVHLAQRNVENGGGPFGACVFETESGKLVAPGVNVVVEQHCSLAHAEAVAIMLAQHRCQTYDLSAQHLPAMELVTSAQPCIQCFGNLWWSGLQRLVTGANKQDVEEITGFQEGPLPHNWVQLLEIRAPLPPIEVVQGVMRESARQVLQAYIDRGGKVYNPAGH